MEGKMELQKNKHLFIVFHNTKFEVGIFNSSWEIFDKNSLCGVKEKGMKEDK